jgi:hypothetical protein
MDIAGMALPAPSQLWQGFQSKAPSVKCYRPPFQSSVEMAGPPLFNRGAPLERAVMISVSKQSAAVKWQPFPSNVLAIARLSSRGTAC